jgi:hypothetical protein
MIKAKYPIIGMDDFLTVEISAPETDPKSKFCDKRCNWKISCSDYKKNGHSWNR